MSEFKEIEVFIVVDEAGDYAIGAEQAAAEESYDSDIGGTASRRCIKMMVKVPLPKPRVVNVTIPAETEDDITVAV